MNIQSLIEDNSGGFSSTRLVFVIWCLVVLSVWAGVSFINNELKPIDSSVITILGILSSAKVVQRFGEKPESKT